jgi:transcriptional regulator with XRE-family HTH domain
VTLERDQILSEFIDAWNAGERPDVDDYLARAPEADRGELADELLAFLTFAPTPAYSDEALQAIRHEPIVADAHGVAAERGAVLPALLTGLRERMSMSTSEVAGELVRMLQLPSSGEAKTASYLARLEQGKLEPARVSRRVFEALGTLFRVPRDELEGAADMGGWATVSSALASPAPVFRADKEAAADVSRHLEVLADALATPGGERRDEVDELFLGGR